MADPSRSPDTGGIPRWVKLAGISVIVLALLVVVMLLIGGGGGGHGPRRHAPSGDPSGQTPPSSVTASGGVAGHTPPDGGHEGRP
jgi:hypothetical protein